MTATLQQVYSLLQTVHANQRIIFSGLGTIQGQLSLLRFTITQQGTAMAEDFTNLNAAVSNLQTEVGAIGTQMDTLLADLNAALAGGNQPAIDAATAALQTQINALKAIQTRDMPPAPPPGP
jgi:hypothetical protein